MPRPCEVSTPRTGGGAVALSRWHLEGCGISLRSQRRLLSSRWAMGMEKDAFQHHTHQSDRHVRCCEIILSLNWPISEIPASDPPKKTAFHHHSPNKNGDFPPDFWVSNLQATARGLGWLRQLLPSQGSSGGGSGRSGRLGAQRPVTRWPVTKSAEAFTSTTMMMTSGRSRYIHTWMCLKIVYP